MRRADERRDPARLGGDLVERAARCAQEAGPEEEVLGRIAGHGQLGEEDEIGACVAGLAQAFEDTRAVAVEVPDDRVHLRKGDPHRFNSSGFRLRGENASALQVRM
jgi:hypothetical protein